jgi:hypothetical protein
LYKKSGEYLKMNQMREKIATFAGATEDGKNAVVELVNP